MTRFYGRLDLDRDARRWVLTSGQVHVALSLKANFRRLRKSDVSPFSFPWDDVHAAELAWFLMRYPMAMEPADLVELEAGKARYEGSLAEVDRILDPAFAPPPCGALKPGKAIRPYQEQPVALVMATGSLLLGDDVGLGKSYVAIRLALNPEALPMAIVVYPHLQRQWREKFEEMCDLGCHLVETTRPYALPDVPVILFRYSNVRGWADVFATGRFKSAVWDEIQELRTGRSTAKGEASHALSRNTSYQLGLSATPIFNLGGEIYDVLDFLPGRATGHVLGTPTEFAIEWGAPGGAVSDPTALGAYLRDRNVFIRRTKGDVGQQMDAVTRIPVDVPYDEAEERRIEDLARILAIRTVSGSFVERGRASRDLDILLRQATGLAKARGVAQVVRMIVETGQRVLVSGWHRGFYDILRREIDDLGVCLYTGSESPSQKERAKASFIAGDCRVMAISNRSGAGLDGIQHVCSNLVIGELDWSGEIHKQLIGRLDREGQTLPVSAYFCISDGGSDPAMVEVLGIKAAQVSGIVDLGLSIDRGLSDEGRLTRLAKSWLDRRGIDPDREASLPERPDPVALDLLEDA